MKLYTYDISHAIYHVYDVIYQVEDWWLVQTGDHADRSSGAPTVVKTSTAVVVSPKARVGKSDDSRRAVEPYAR